MKIQNDIENLIEEVLKLKWTPLSAKYGKMPEVTVVVLTAHEEFEYLVDILITRFFIKVEHENFQQFVELLAEVDIFRKVNFCKRLKIIDDDLFSIFTKINELRLRFAHERKHWKIKSSFNDNADPNYKKVLKEGLDSILLFNKKYINFIEIK